jgi:hypothetical protein
MILGYLIFDLVKVFKAFALCVKVDSCMIEFSLDFSIIACNVADSSSFNDD